ncbi:Uncharacterized conserved protein [Parasphingorhabdus marina DSM 22363]|uniref:Uncharacterized conserved protein n=1 Tax=Parasphingorhabdus marina DSM 22363 TaxID=1123272 RepID=A0A1N6G8K5_9SPHN|nr:GFA family protein [Parasphingorhabdus marina]SIO03838.1 Uncharacterized conserved protein [Parasphingorhabdus marina DSM 22363]
MQAQCQCGQLTVRLPGPSPAIVACHCIDCQRRSGSPFGVAVYHPTENLQITGQSKQYVRETASGGEFRTDFCPQCGSTVLMSGDKNPGLTGIPVGAIADPDFPPPVRSVWEESMHEWVTIETALEHFDQGRPKT